MADKTESAKKPSAENQFQLILGTFIDNEFVWHEIKKFSDLETAYKEYKKYANKQMSYTDKELKKVWNSGRLDIELRRGNKLLNWCGIYSRAAIAETDDEEKASDDKQKEPTKDSFDGIDPCDDLTDVLFEDSDDLIDVLFE